MNELNKESLLNLLQSLDNHFYYYPNPGNAGDSLIGCATLQFFNDNNLSYDIVLDTNFSAKGKTVVYGGGGNFGGDNSRVGKFIDQSYRTAKNVVVLPHTIYGADKILSKLEGNCHIICREMVSYEYVKNTAKDANVYLHDDMVFMCDIKRLLNKPKKINFLPYIIKEFWHKVIGNKDFDFGLSLKGYLSFNKFFKNNKVTHDQKNKVLNAFRIDVEKTSDIVPEGNIDLSAILELSSCEPSLSKYACYYFLDEINKYDEVRTNRLHIAIAAACLGKKVKLYANNYFKIRAIYEYSMAGKFDNVEWMES